jgi:hypothetical protein
MFVLLAGLVMGACSSDDDGQVAQEPSQEQTQTPQKSYPLSIEVAENPMIQDGEEGSSSRRAAITTGTTLNGFNMNYVYGEAAPGSLTATKTSEGQWTNSEGWPSDAVEGNPTVYWYASTSGTFNRTDDANKYPYINFTVEEAAASQHDLLVATASGTYIDTGGKLTFTFDHVCAALRFYVKKSTNLSGYTVTVSSIVLRNVVNQGKYYYGSKEWTLTESRSNYTLLSSAKTLGSGSGDYQLLNGSEDNSYLFLIPQTLTPWDPTGALGNVYLSVVCTITKISDSSNIFNGTAYIPFSATFAAGKKYDVKINIGKNSLYSGTDTKIISD